MRHYVVPGLVIVAALYLMMSGTSFDLGRSLYLLGGVLCVILAFILLFLRRAIDFRRVRFVSLFIPPKLPAK